MIEPTSKVISDIENFLEQLLRMPNRAEAISWLKGSSENSYRTLGELSTTEESLALVERASAAGAVSVIAIEIENYPDGSENAGRLIIELPDDPNTRGQILKWCDELGAELGLEPEGDFGQRYTLVMLD